MQRILIVEDEAIVSDLLCAILEDDYEIVCAGTRDEALLLLTEQSIDLMLLDHGLPGGGSDQVAKRADDIGVPLVWMSGDHTAIDSVSRPILLKPFRIDRVLEVLSEVRTVRPISG